jgi:outer membrane autotransporter protein
MRERLFVIAVSIVFGIPIILAALGIPGDVWATVCCTTVSSDGSTEKDYNNRTTDNKASPVVLNQRDQSAIRSSPFWNQAMTFAEILRGDVFLPPRDGDQSFLEDEKSFASFAPQGPGMSAQARARGIGLWANVSYSNYDDDLPSTAFDGDTITGFAGIDYQVHDQLILGVGIGYENSDVDTAFNSGNSDTDGITGMAYVVILTQLPWLSFDFNAGYTDTDTDSRRITPAGALVTSSNDGQRVFGGGNTNVSFWFDNFNVGGNFGYVFSRSTTDRFIESNGTIVPTSDVSLAQIRVGARASYYWPLAQPYVSVTYEHDTVHNQVDVGPGQLVPSDDPDDVVVGGGVNFSITDQISGGIDGSVVLGRDNFDSFTVSGNIRYSF